MEPPAGNPVTPPGSVFSASHLQESETEWTLYYKEYDWFEPFTLHIEKAQSLHEPAERMYRWLKSDEFVHTAAGLEEGDYPECFAERMLP